VLTEVCTFYTQKRENVISGKVYGYQFYIPIFNVKGKGFEPLAIMPHRGVES
jgi:hypothetical protein